MSKKGLLFTIVSMIILTIAFTASAAGYKKAKSNAGKSVIVKIGTTSDEPRIWEAVEKKLVRDNIKIKIINFANGANPNVALADGEVDLNAFQHYAYFNKNKQDLKLDLTAIGDTLIVPLNLFSKKVKLVSELKKNAKIAIPNDVTNEGRALRVLENAGLIKLKDGVGLAPHLNDIVSNPFDLTFVELAGAQISRSLEDVDAAVINCGYAVDAGFDPNKDPIFKDKVDLSNPNQKPYINIIAARTKDKDNPVYKKVVKAYQSSDVAKVIKEVYRSAAIPAWDEKYVRQGDSSAK